MNTFSTQKNPETIIHLGAGRCRELPQYRESGAERIILVEADVDTAAELERQYGSEEQIEILHKAITSHADTSVLRKFNLHRCSSLRKPEKLAELYPGLRKLEEVDVETISASELARQTSVERDEINWLIADIPGEEYDALKNLAAADLLHAFSEITVFCGYEQLYEDSGTIHDLRPFLEDQCFELVSSDEGIDVDRPSWKFHLNTWKVENKKLREDNESYRMKLSDMQEANEELGKQNQVLEKQKENREKDIQDLETQNENLEKERAKAEKTALHKSKLSRKHVNDKRSLRTANKKLQKQVDELTKELKAYLHEHEQQENRIKKLEQSMTDLESRKKNIEKSLQEKVKLLEKKNTEIENLITESENKAQQFDETYKKIEADRDAINKTNESLKNERDELLKKNSIQKKINNEIDTQRQDLENNNKKHEIQIKEQTEKLEQINAIVGEKVKRIEQLEANLIELKEQNKNLRRKNNEIDKQATERMQNVVELSKQLRTYQSEESDFRRKQTLMREEMQNAEGQLELLKEMIFRESD